jgi:flagellar hook-associated protein 1 FlgK
MNLLGQINGAFDSQGADLTGFQVTQVQGQDVLVFASTEQDAVYSYTINANGGLAVADVLRMSDGLPVDTPTAMEIIENGGQRFVVLAAAGTSSLTNDAIPVREMQRKYGAVSLVSAKGMMLIETSAVSFDFNKSNLIAPHMTVQNDQLGALFVDGDEIDGLSTTGPLSGGRLQALFQTRDQTAPLVQAQLDDFALDLATRFHGLPADDVGAASAAGLFSDQGSRVDALNSTGLAGRLQLNAAVDPELGGQLWRLRSGITAPGETPSGDATLISNMIDALSEQRPGNGSIFNHVTTVVSSAALRASEFEQAQSFASSECEQLYQLHLENGVNTDAELQKLLLIETNYAANAKMMQTIDEMFAAIMRIS